MSDRHHNKKDKKSNSWSNKRVGGDSCVTEAGTSTSRSNTSPQLQHQKENANRNRVELLVQEIGLEAAWGFVTIVQELGFDSVFRIVNQISKEQQQQQQQQQCGPTTDHDAAIPCSVSSSSSAATAAAPAVSPDASSTHPSPTPVAFVEKDLVVKQEPEEEEDEGERAESRVGATTSGTTSTAAAADTATATDTEQQSLAQHNDEINSNNNGLIKPEEINNRDTQPTDKSSNSGRKRKQQSPSPSAEDGADPNDNPKATKKTMKNRQAGGHTNDEATISRKQPATANNINDHSPERNFNITKCVIDTNNEDGTDNETNSSTKDNCCRLCGDPDWESKIYYKCGTVISKYFPKSNNNPNPGWYKGTISMHHISSSNSGFDSDSEYEEEDNSSDKESEQQFIVLNEIHYEDGDVENITQKYLKLQVMGGSGVKILHGTNIATASNDHVDDVAPPTPSDNEFDRNWLKQYHRLQQFQAENGHCRVPHRYGADPPLGRWVQRQRIANKKGNLDPDRAEKLEDIGFKCDARAEMWDEIFGRLEQFKAENGNSRVPTRYGPDPSLANWVYNQRRICKQGKLAGDRKKKLNKIGFEWDTGIGAKTTPWEENFDKLKQYKANHGNTRVPNKYVPDPSLGKWVTKQRRNYKKGTLAPDRAEKLEKIRFDWDPFDQTWGEMFARLEQFKAENGHCLVPNRYGPDPSLGIWVTKQRAAHKKGIMANDRAEKLEEIGFEWRLRNR